MFEGSSNCQLLMFHRVLRNCAGKKFDRIVKRGVPDSRVLVVVRIRIRTLILKCHTTYAPHVQTHTFAHLKVYRFICSVILGYIFWHPRRNSVYFTCIRKSSPTGRIKDVSNDKLQMMLILLEGSVHRA